MACIAIVIGVALRTRCCFGSIDASMPRVSSLEPPEQPFRTRHREYAAGPRCENWLRDPACTAVGSGSGSGATLCLLHTADNGRTARATRPRSRLAAGGRACSAQAGPPNSREPESQGSCVARSWCGGGETLCSVREYGPSETRTREALAHRGPVSKRGSRGC